MCRDGGPRKYGRSMRRSRIERDVPQIPGDIARKLTDGGEFALTLDEQAAADAQIAAAKNLIRQRHLAQLRGFNP